MKDAVLLLAYMVLIPALAFVLLAVGLLVAHSVAWPVGVLLAALIIALILLRGFRHWTSGRASDKDACFRQLPAPLQDWLAVATRGLGEDSRRRIAQEVSAHYGDALTELESVGTPDAERQALASLGDPGSARRGFRRAYLSARQEAWIHQVEKHEQNSLWRVRPAFIVVCGVIMLMTLAYEHWYENEGVSPYQVLVGFGFVTTGMIEILVRDRIRVGRLRRAKILEIALIVVLGVGFFPAMMVFASPGLPALWWTGMIVMIVGSLVWAGLEVRTIRKLPQHLEDESPLDRGDD